MNRDLRFAATGYACPAWAINMFYKDKLRFFIASIAIIILISDGSAFNLSAETGRPDLSGLSYEEKLSIELACSREKSLGSAKYNRCLRGLLTDLKTAPRRPDLSGLSFEEKYSIESACSYEKSLGPATYNRCLQGQLAELKNAPRRPDLSGLSLEEKHSIEFACSEEKSLGPATYNRCLQRHLDELKNAPRRPDLSGLSYEEKHSIEIACSYEKSLGPTTYNRCLQRQLAEAGLPLASPHRAASSQIRKAQVLLSELNYDPGPMDSIMGKNTRKAIIRFQKDFDLPITAEVDQKLLNQLDAAHKIVKREGKQKISSEVLEPKPNYYGQIPETAEILPAMPSKIKHQTLTAADLFNNVKSSVFAVLASSSKFAMKQKEDLSQGSAVAVSNRQLLTNCHVLKNKPFIIIIQGKKVAQAMLSGKDENLDMCVLTSKNFNLAPVEAIRKFEGLAVGETVYTVGTPVGLQQTLGVGIISGLRRYKGLLLIQTSAPISGGSSGGGLFDSNGNLIGITSFLLKGAQNLNFAIAAEQYWK